MNILVLITATLFAFVLCTPAQDRDTVFKDPIYPFSVSFPSTWKATGRSDSKIRLEVISDNGKGATNFAVAVTPAKGSEKTPASTLVKLFLEDRPELIQAIADTTLRNAKVVSKGPTYLSNQDAFFAIYQGEFRTTIDTVFIKTYFVETLFEGNVYAITFTTSQEDFTKFFSTFKEIASNFGLSPTRVSIPQKPRQ